VLVVAADATAAASVGEGEENFPIPEPLSLAPLSLPRLSDVTRCVAPPSRDVVASGRPISVDRAIHLFITARRAPVEAIFIDSFTPLEVAETPWNSSADWNPLNFGHLLSILWLKICANKIKQADQKCTVRCRKALYA